MKSSAGYDLRHYETEKRFLSILCVQNV